MILGVGIDIVKISRIERILARGRKRFFERVYTQRELEAAKSRGAAHLEYLAMLFAAKEAVFKSLGITWEGIEMRDIEVIRGNAGRPIVEFRGELREIARKLGVKRVILTLSSDKEHAVACAVALGKYGSESRERKES